MDNKILDIDMIQIGQRIRDARTKQHVTQTEIYDKCGISSGALSMIENGKRVPTIAVMYKLACVLGCSIDWLITGASPDEEISNSDTEKLLHLYQHLPAKDQKELLALAELKSKLNSY